MKFTYEKLLIAVLVLFLLVVAWVFRPQEEPLEGQFEQFSQLAKAHASTTAGTLSTDTSTLIAATSTRQAASATLPITAGRLALSFQSINCGTGAAVWVQFNDVAAAENTGYHLAASSTLNFADTVPMVHGAVRALSSDAACTLLVTEWRSER